MYKSAVMTSNTTTTLCGNSSHSPHTGEHSPVWGLGENLSEQLMDAFVMSEPTSTAGISEVDSPCGTFEKLTGDIFVRSFVKVHLLWN